jgi:hypothetical protein
MHSLIWIEAKLNLERKTDEEIIKRTEKKVMNFIKL